MGVESVTHVGVDVAGYLGEGDTLCTWDGRTVLGGRSERYGQYRTPDDDTAFGVYWMLPRGRAVVGYCLGGVGMLVRGELTDLSGVEAGLRVQAVRREVLRVCDHWLGLDQEQYDADEFGADTADE